MIIGVDGTIWGGEERGVAQATRRLIRAAVSLPGAHEFRIFAAHFAFPGDGEEMRRPHVRFLPVEPRRGGRRVLWQQAALPGRARQQHCHVLYSPCYTIPLFRSAPPAIVTVHDVIAFQRPDLCRVSNVIHFRSLLAASVRRAAFVTVPTETVRRELVERLGADESKVRVIPWASAFEGPPPDRAAAEERVRRRHAITPPFILFVGGVEPKKNLKTLFEAMRGVQVPLVMAGPTDNGEAVRRLPDGPRVRHLGYASRDELRDLYRAATVFAFPSHAEGFGLPVLEAMSCGAPVVTSEAPALREVCGGAAIHVPATDVAALRESLNRLLGDVELRTDLAGRGRTRADQFSWKASGKLLLDIAEETAQDRGGP